MNIPFNRLRHVLIPRSRRPSDRLEIPAAVGASDSELAHLGSARHTVEDARQQVLTLVYGGRRNG